MAERCTRARIESARGRAADVEGVASRWAAIGRRLVEHEAAGRRDTEALAVATERACARLREHLVPIIGPEGFRVLLANAVAITQTEHAFLQSVDTRARPNGCLPWLGGAVRGVSEAETTLVVTRLLGHFMELLAGFIGEGLTMRLVERAWPESPWTKGASDRETGA